MNLQFFGEVIRALGHLDIWVGGLFWGWLLLLGANYLAADYAGPRSVFDAVLSVLVFSGMGIFFVLVGPAMVVKTAPFPAAAVWTSSQTHFTPQRALVAFAVGLLFAILSRVPPAGWVVTSRLPGCLTQALATLSSIAYFATDGTGRFVPGPLVLLGLGMSGLFVVIVAQAILESVLPKGAARAWIFLGPLLVSLAAAPYAGWLRTVNP